MFNPANKNSSAIFCNQSQGKDNFHDRGNECKHLHVRIRSRSRRGDDSDGSEDFSFGTERSLDLSQAGLEDAFPENVPPFLRWVEIFSKKVNIPREQWRAPMPAPLVS